MTKTPEEPKVKMNQTIKPMSFDEFKIYLKSIQRQRIIWGALTHPILIAFIMLCIITYIGFKY